MCCKKLMLILSAFAFNQAGATCDTTACTVEPSFSSPELYARSSAHPAPILVFISFSMPEQSLKLWAEQAFKIKAPLVIRGFLRNSIAATTQKAFELFATDKMPELLVDPEAFERFGIKVVPAVVAVSQDKPSNGSSVASVAPFEVVYGDTSLNDALDVLLSRGSAAIQKVVAPALERLAQSDD